jgi:chromate reductase, NAD(P)H dehydrogenase (quinone)
VVRVLGICGSLRRDSYNTMLLRAAGDLAPAGVELTIYDGLRDIAPYDDDRRHAPPTEVRRLRAALAAADAVLVATPEYNSSIPGQLKNALDWMSRPLLTSPLRNKPTAVVGASTGMFGAVWAQAEARKVLAAIGARVLDRELPVPDAESRFAAGRLADREIARELSSIMEALGEAVRVRERAAA